MRSVRLKKICGLPDNLAAELLIDDKHKVVLPVEYEYVDPGREILETGISKIELAASQQWNRDYEPWMGEAKWFRDELGQIWVKFQTARVRTVVHPHDTEEIVEDLTDHVWAANRVVVVTYKK
jgi:hypothetical protein